MSSDMELTAPLQSPICNRASEGKEVRKEATEEGRAVEKVVETEEVETAEAGWRWRGRRRGGGDGGGEGGALFRKGDPALQALSASPGKARRPAKAQETG